MRSIIGIVCSLVLAVSSIYCAETDALDLRENVRFFLYTRANRNVPRQLWIGDVGDLYNASKPTKFYAHSFNSSYADDDSSLVRGALLLARFDYNVIVVDWGNVARSQPYEAAIGHAKAIGAYVAEMIDFLVSLGNKPNDMSLIGYGVGAHLMGSAGYLATNKVTHAVGLDPATSGFDTEDPSLRISKQSASSVEIVHTSDNSTSYGHLDFHPNGGAIQPGCADSECSSRRAYAYYAETLAKPNKWFGVQCDNYQQFLERNYANRPIESFPHTFGLVKKAPGLYYTRTAASSPYGLGFAGLTP